MTEHERLRALLGLGHLNEHTADEERVYYGAHQRLEQKQDDALRALLGYIAVAVANGCLGFNEKEER